MSSHLRILCIAGSLRRGSYNQAALRAAKLLVPEKSEIDSFHSSTATARHSLSGGAPA